MKKSSQQQYHSNDILNGPHDDLSVKASRRCSNFGSLNKKDLDAMINGKKVRNSVTGQTVTHEYLPEMDIVCGYIQLDFENDEKLIPVYAILYDYELILFENEKCTDEICRITTEGSSAYNEIKPKSKSEKSDKSENRKSKYEKGRSQTTLVEVTDMDESKEEDFSFTINTNEGTFKIHTINNSSMIRWMATINTASSNISLALHLSSQHQQHSESVFDISEKLPSNSNPYQEDDFLLWKPIIMIRIAHYIKRWLTLCSIDFRVLSYIDLSTKEENSKDKSKLPEFINLDATAIAYKLTQMESEQFNSIKPIEFILNLWNTNDQSPYIQHEMKDLKKMVEASNHEIIKNTKNIEENRLPSPTVYGSPTELMNKNIPIVQLTNSKAGESFDIDSIKARKKKNRISDLESRFKNIDIPEIHTSLDNIDTSNFLDCTKLNSPIFNMDCVSMPSLNKDKESDEKEDTIGEINNSLSTRNYRPHRQSRLSNATITSVNSYNNRSYVDEDDIHFENNEKCNYPPIIYLIKFFLLFYY
ncbi:hypothetical protein PIROE2DRAFT_63748 [Piromyces sp. E2]|nr:hypothetical protein PIROE2DRAFT_63748 [Piromyces sp. E2]|eukprot:OUM59487.1 hypothetical protein PIROE2DRAFT_63748 [Piromyces sp. E2]